MSAAKGFTYWIIRLHVHRTRGRPVGCGTRGTRCSPLGSAHTNLTTQRTNITLELILYTFTIKR